MKAARVMGLVLVLALVASPALADGQVRIGDRINLFGPSPLYFPQGQPFYVAHGHVIPPGERVGAPAPIGRFSFGLDVDGVVQPSDFTERTVTEEVDLPPTFTLVWVFNFPEGMQGTHVFTGHWYAPCAYAVSNGLYAGSCITPAAVVEYATRSIEVIFY